MHQPMPIIIGAPRSGTTLLRFMLDSHPDLAIPPETGFLALGQQFTRQGDALRHEFFRAITHYPPEAPNWQDFQIPKEFFWATLTEVEPFTISDGYRTYYRLHTSRFGKRRWGDKNPGYCHHIKTIEAILPEAHFVHIIRDGHDAALSLRQMWFSPGWAIETQALHWVNFVRSARQQGANSPHYLEIRYEDLIPNPQETLQQVCNYLELAYSDMLLKYYDRIPQRLQEHKGRFHIDGTLILSDEQRILQQQKTTQPLGPRRVFNWKWAMSTEEQARFESMTGSLLKELGYESK